MPSGEVAAEVELCPNATNTPFPKVTEAQLALAGKVLAVAV